MKKLIKDIGPDSTFTYKGERYRLDSKLYDGPHGEVYYLVSSKETGRNYIFTGETEVISLDQEVFKRVMCSEVAVGEVFIYQDLFYTLTSYCHGVNKSGDTCTLPKHVTVIVKA